MNNTSEFFIRSATSSDIGILADLSARTFVSAYQSMLPEQALLDFGLYRLCREMCRNLGCKRAYARLHPKFQASIPLKTEEPDFVASAFSLENVREEMNAPGNRFLLAYEGEKPVGYALLREAALPGGLTGNSPGDWCSLRVDPVKKTQHRERRI